MFALELSYSPDWLRFRTSYFFASGDSDVSFGDHNATGFDTIFDNRISPEAVQLLAEESSQAVWRGAGEPF
jgi:hypothetical protein